MQIFTKRQTYLALAFLLVCPMLNLVPGACGANQLASSTLAGAAQQTPPNTLIESQQPVLSTSGTLIPYSNNTQIPADSWQTRWLRSIPCKAPCWEGITPGITTMEEAAKLLKQNPLINPNSIKITVDNYDKSVEDLAWKWITNVPGGTLYSIHNSSQSVVKEIDPYYDPMELTLNNIIQLLGQPNYILADREKAAEGPPVYGVSILFTQQGFLINANNVPQTQPILEPNMLVKQPRFFPPQNNPGDLGKPYSTQSQVWQGFKDFNFYCRDADKPDKPCT